MPADGTDRQPAMPRFAEVVGIPIATADISSIVQHSIEEMCAGLQCVRLIALSHAPRENVLRGVSAVALPGEGIRELHLALSELPTMDRAVRTGSILVLDDAAQLSPRLIRYFTGEVVVVPLRLGAETLAVLVGQTAPGVEPRSGGWQDRAHEMAARAGLVVELERVASAYRDEISLRQAGREVAAAMLEGRPQEQVGELILNVVTQRLSVPRAALYLKDDSERYRPLILRGIAAEMGEIVERMPQPGPTVARAIATGLPMHARRLQEDERIDPELRAVFQRESINSALIAMLHHGDKITGILCVYPDDEREFTPAELSLFQSFADQAALAAATGQLLEQQRKMATMGERERLAREMHDTVAQTLSGLVLQIGTMHALFASTADTGLVEMLQDAQTQARKALEDTRRAVQGLVPTALERLTPAQAIAEEAHQFEARTGIPTRFIHSGVEQPLLAEQRTALLRIAQESLSNVQKHASAERVRIGLTYSRDTVTLIVEDDGAGFDPARSAVAQQEGSYGLFGMRERARLLGGTVLVDSTPGWGTRIRVDLPYRPTSSLPQPVDRVPAIPQPGAPAHALEEAAPPIRVVIADDHVVTRQGIRSLLQTTADIRVVGEAANGEEAVHRAAELEPDVVLMDLQMPGIDGIEGLRRLHEALPELPVVILTTYASDSAIAEALAAGARGFLHKNAELAELISAVRAARRGEAHLGPAVASQLPALAAGRSDEIVSLNEREQEILALLVEGARNKEIAAQLFISASTVEYHLSNLFAKLGVTNRTEAARVAVRRRLVPPK